MSHATPFNRRSPRALPGSGFAAPEVRQEVIEDVPAPGLEPRTLTAYLPPGRRTGTVPLLLALDGQTMPRWRLGAALQALAAEGVRELPVVVAVPAARDRTDEYGMAGGADFAGRGVLAEQFQNYLVHGVLPVVRQRYGAGLRAETTGLFGASMGGLCAFDTAWRHPEAFGFAGVFSGSLWWRADNADAAAQQRSRLAHRLVRETRVAPRLRLWFEAGTADESADRDGNGVIDAIQDTTELIDELVARGLSRGPDLVYREVSGGRHHEETWADVLPDFLRWALPARV